MWLCFTLNISFYLSSENLLSLVKADKINAQKPRQFFFSQYIKTINEFVIVILLFFKPWKYCTVCKKLKKQ
jgi:hypothetical protein